MSPQPDFRVFSVLRVLRVFRVLKVFIIFRVSKVLMVFRVLRFRETVFKKSSAES